jgi:hypothetical protein
LLDELPSEVSQVDVAALNIVQSVRVAVFPSLGVDYFLLRGSEFGGVCVGEPGLELGSDCILALAVQSAILGALFAVGDGADCFVEFVCGVHLEFSPIFRKFLNRTFLFDVITIQQ